MGAAIAAKYTLEGEGLPGEAWDVKSDVITGICTEFSEPLFLRPSSIRSDAWVGFPVLFLIALATGFRQKSRQTSHDIEVIEQKLLGFEHTRNDTPAILSFQETWDIPNLELKGFVCYGNKNGYASLQVSDNFSTI